MNHPTHWTEYLPCAVFMRLAECHTRKADLSILLDAKWRFAQDTGKDKQGYTKEDCLVDILDLLDCNGLDNVIELTQTEWDELLK